MNSLSGLIPRVRKLLVAEEFKNLMIDELGWDNPNDSRKITVKIAEVETTYGVLPIASKRGMTVFHCPRIPDRKAMAQIDREISRRSLERMIVFSENGGQIWRWPEPRKAGGTRFVNHEFVNRNPTESIIQRLAAIRFTLEEEQSLSVLAVRDRVRLSFNSDEVTARFYHEFEVNQKSLAEEVEGIKSPEECSWYSSLLLNRLMFIYFMQRKGFLNDDPHYLRSSLIAVRQLKGRNKFYGFYRDFLIPLFHDGLGSEFTKEIDPEIKKIIGDVPYINGGIFALHVLEERHKIKVPDEAFERIFTFFDRFRWHLDERESAEPGEINPDVLGYIFEKYVNQKQQGAFYTKEDVTGYMSVAAILPVILDNLISALERNPWHLLADQPLRYIPESLQYGFQIGLPEPIAMLDSNVFGGLDDHAESDVGLPGERWRETKERLQFVEELVARLRAGAISSTSEAVHTNLDLVTLVVDWVATFTNPADISKVWQTLIKLNILDPTCGSGAFLFAALDVLEEIYEITIRRAREVLNEGVDTSRDELMRIVDDMTRHPSTEYFLLKTIVLENIYGVDIMAEAVEIARLRLFLALVSRLEHRSQIEPLPDLDMNIKVGNILVGCSTFADAESKFANNLFAIEALDSLRPKAMKLVATYNGFVHSQRTGVGPVLLGNAKAVLIADSSAVRDELDYLYAAEVGVKNNIELWRKKQTPFHWLIEFPEAISAGGFDAVIGNPPYINRRKITQYQYSGFETDSCNDIFAPCMERAANLVRDNGGLAMIVPIAFQFSEDYSIARKVIAKKLPTRWVSTYSRNPSSLFDAAVGVRSTIVIGRAGSARSLSTSSLRRWPEEARQHLFATTRYANFAESDTARPWPRLGSADLARLYDELISNGRAIGMAVRRTGEDLGFKQTALYYLSVFIDEPPSWTMAGRRTPQTKVGKIRFQSIVDRDVAFILLAGRLAVWWWGATGDDFDVTSGLLESFPVSHSEVEPIKKELLVLAKALRKEQLKNPLVTKYAGKEMGNYDMSRCRYITDQADRLVLDALGLTELWPSVLTADAWLAKATGERPGTRRAWPFPL